MREKFIVSEDAYALIGSAMIANRTNDAFFAEIAAYFAGKLIARMDPETGNIPAEHSEAPSGTHLADMIYTVNWALLGMSMMTDQCANILGVGMRASRQKVWRIKETSPF